jgi:hypothetical protein
MLYGQNVIVLPADPEAKRVRDAFQSALDLWGTRMSASAHIPGAVTGLEKARKALETVEAALVRLGKRDDERGRDARSYLEPIKNQITSAIAAYEAVGHDCSGPVAGDLISRREAQRIKVAGAQQAFHAAGPADVLARRNELDVVEAEFRELERETAKLRDSCTFPSLPDLRIFEQAESETRKILTRIKKSKDKPATTLEIALLQGAAHAGESHSDVAAVRSRAPSVARLWVFFEENQTHEAIKLRWARYCEGRNVEAIEAETKRNPKEETDLFRMTMAQL